MPSDAVNKVLKLSAGGVFEEVPDADYTGADLGDWYVVIANGTNGITLTRANFELLSKDREVVFCCVEEHVMCSMATGWRDGHRIWSVTHESDKGIEHLNAGGELPAVYDSINERLRNLQETAKDRDIVDYIFDIPVELAGAITGFWHDRDIVGKEQPFEVLNPDSDISLDDGSEKKTWLSRLFSRFF